MRFQPTLPVRGATPGGRCWSDVSPFQPTLPVRGATAWAPTTTRRSLISTHAPRAGSDRPPAGWSPSGSYFNPRSPCGERQAAHAAGKWPDGFQPTLPVRGATSRPYNSTRRYLYFNPRSPCGERRHALCVSGFQIISTHAPRAGSDRFLWRDYMTKIISTHAPRAGSDISAGHVGVVRGISTHAPRAGSDVGDQGQAHDEGISTHAPRAGSDLEVVPVLRLNIISTHAPRAGSDFSSRKYSRMNPISTHAPRAGSDSEILFAGLDDVEFQPTLPVRGATYWLPGRSICY